MSVPNLLPMNINVCC